MASSKIKRVLKELKELAESDSELKKQVWIEAKNDSLTEFVGFVKGAVGTPYAHGTFQVSISIPENYPFSPPKAQFITKIWHPNVSSATGCLCINILKNAWTPSYTMKAILLSIQALLMEPNSNDPQDGLVALQMKKSKKKFQTTAQFWTFVHAQGISHEDVMTKQLTPDLQRLREMVIGTMNLRGTTFHDALIHLSTNNWRVEPQMTRTLRSQRSTAPWFLEETRILVSNFSLLHFLLFFTFTFITFTRIKQPTSPVSS